MDDFIDTGSGGGIGFGLCEGHHPPVIDEEIITSPRRYHTITEAKNGEGAPPIKTEKGWLHIAHGVRNTAAGLRYVVYVFVTDLHEPWKVIAEPSGFLIAPRGWERIGDVSNVVFTNGAIARTTAKCTSTTPPATPGCTWPAPRWTACWTLPSTPRPTRCAAVTAWPSAAP